MRSLQLNRCFRAAHCWGVYENLAVSGPAPLCAHQPGNFCLPAAAGQTTELGSRVALEKLCSLRQLQLDLQWVSGAVDCAHF